MRIDRDKVELAMARKKMTQEELAEAYGVTRSGMASVLRSLNVKPTTVGRLAAALGVDPEEIIVTKEVM